MSRWRAHASCALARAGRSAAEALDWGEEEGAVGGAGAAAAADCASDGLPQPDQTSRPGRLGCERALVGVGTRAAPSAAVPISGPMPAVIASRIPYRCHRDHLIIITRGHTTAGGKGGTAKASGCGGD